MENSKFNFHSKNTASGEDLQRIDETRRNLSDFPNTAGVDKHRERDEINENMLRRVERAISHDSQSSGKYSPLFGMLN